MTLQSTHIYIYIYDNYQLSKECNNCTKVLKNFEIEKTLLLKQYL